MRPRDSGRQGFLSAAPAPSRGSDPRVQADLEPGQTTWKQGLKRGSAHPRSRRQFSRQLKAESIPRGAEHTVPKRAPQAYAHSGLKVLENSQHQKDTSTRSPGSRTHVLPGRMPSLPRERKAASGPEAGNGARRAEQAETRYFSLTCHPKPKPLVLPILHKWIVSLPSTQENCLLRSLLRVLYIWSSHVYKIKFAFLLLIYLMLI